MDKIKEFIIKHKYLVVILVTTFIVFAPSIKGIFLHWDDDTYILNNQSLTSLSLNNIKTIFFSYYYGLYNPITNLTWAIEYSVVELNPWLYHLNNIILHLINVSLVYILFKKYIIQNKEIALITASLFALAPIHVESVAWITERKDVLYTAFYLLSLIFYLKYLTFSKHKYYVLSLFIFSLSILSKGMAASFPLVLIVVDYLQNRKLFNIKLILEKIPFFAISFIMGILNIYAQRDFYGVRKDIYSIGEQILFSSYSFTQYIVKSIIPYKLSVFYPYPETNSVLVTYWVYVVFVLALIALTIYFIIKKKKEMIFAFSFFVFNIVFILQIFLHNTEAVFSDRYAYLSSIGIYLLIALLLNKLKNKNIAKYTVIIYLIIMSVLTFNRSIIWQNDISLFLDAYKKYPNSFIITNSLGNSYMRNRDLQNAEKFFKLTIKSHQNYAKAYSNLGGVLSMQNKLDEGLRYFNEAIEIMPKNSNFYLNRAKLLFQQKKYAKVIADCNKSIELKKNNYNSYSVRAIAYLYSDSLRNAINDYNFLQNNYSSETKNLNIEFNKLANYYSNLGIDYGKKEDFEHAIECFNKALLLNPQHKNAKQNLNYAKKLLNK